MSWPIVTVADIALPIKGSIVSGPFGSNISSKFFVDEGLPVIRGNNLSTGMTKFIDNGFVFISEEKAKEFHNCEAIEDDLIFTAAGTLGQVGIIPKVRRFEKYIISNKQLRLRCDKTKVEPLYAFYWFSSPQMVKHIISRNTGVSIPLINLSVLRSLPIPFPSLMIQRRIASILAAYDDLIENNNRRIALLEESMRLLYREWFVRLHFPGYEHVRVVDGLPEGWTKKPLSELCDLTMGQSPPSEFYNFERNGLPFHQGVTGFGIRFISNEMYCANPNRIAEPGDILFSVRAPVGRINITLDRIIIGRGLAALRSKTENQSFLYYQLRDHFYKEDMLGSGAIFASVTKNELSKELLLAPRIELVIRFNEIARSSDKLIENLHQQNIRLSEARDMLLPRLISGEITVS